MVIKEDAMKDIHLVLVVLIFVGLLLIASAIAITMHRSYSVTRIVAEQIDFDDYEFVFPDGRVVNMRYSVDFVAPSEVDYPS